VPEVERLPPVSRQAVPRLNLYFPATPELAAIEAAAAAARMPVATWAKARLVEAASREGYVAGE
jgi:hypothetical protein